MSLTTATSPEALVLNEDVMAASLNFFFGDDVTLATPRNATEDVYEGDPEAMRVARIINVALDRAVVARYGRPVEAVAYATSPANVVLAVRRCPDGTDGALSPDIQVASRSFDVVTLWGSDPTVRSLITCTVVEMESLWAQYLVLEQAARFSATARRVDAIVERIPLSTDIPPLSYASPFVVVGCEHCPCVFLADADGDEFYPDRRETPGGCDEDCECHQIGHLYEITTNAGDEVTAVRQLPWPRTES
jgi:hypothetical protein